MLLHWNIDHIETVLGDKMISLHISKIFLVGLTCLSCHLTYAQSPAVSEKAVRLEVVWIDWLDPETRSNAPDGMTPRDANLEKLLLTAVYQAFEKSGYAIDQSSPVTVRVVAEGVTKLSRYKDRSNGRITMIPVEYSGKYRVLVFNRDKKPKKFVDRFSFAPHIQLLPASSNGSKAKTALLVHDWLLKKLAKKSFRKHLE